MTHSRLKSICSVHPSDITKGLASLVRDGFLESSGASRGTCYFFPGKPPGSEGLDSQHLSLPNSQHLNPSSQHLAESSQQIPSQSALLEPSSPSWKDAEELTSQVRKSRKSSKEDVQNIILAVACMGYITLKDLATLLDRKPLTLQNHYIHELLKNGSLVLRYPDKPNHPGQAYRAAQ